MRTLSVIIGACFVGGGGLLARDASPAESPLPTLSPPPRVALPPSPTPAPRRTARWAAVASSCLTSSRRRLPALSALLALAIAPPDPAAASSLPTLEAIDLTPNSSNDGELTPPAAVADVLSSATKLLAVLGCVAVFYLLRIACDIDRVGRATTQAAERKSKSEQRCVGQTRRRRRKGAKKKKNKKHIKRGRGISRKIGKGGGSAAPWSKRPYPVAGEEHGSTAAFGCLACVATISLALLFVVGNLYSRDASVVLQRDCSDLLADWLALNAIPVILLVLTDLRCFRIAVYLPVYLSMVAINCILHACHCIIWSAITSIYLCWINATFIIRVVVAWCAPAYIDTGAILELCGELWLVAQQQQDLRSAGAAMVGQQFFSSVPLLWVGWCVDRTPLLHVELIERCASWIGWIGWCVDCTQLLHVELIERCASSLAWIGWCLDRTPGVYELLERCASSITWIGWCLDRTPGVCEELLERCASSIAWIGWCVDRTPGVHWRLILSCAVLSLLVVALLAWLVRNLAATSLSSASTEESVESSEPSVPLYKAGMRVHYKNAAGTSRAEILDVHFDDLLEPYYSIRLDDGREKQTDNAHISLLPGDGHAVTEEGGEKSEASRSASNSCNNASTEESAAPGESSARRIDNEAGDEGEGGSGNAKGEPGEPNGSGSPHKASKSRRTRGRGNASTSILSSSFSSGTLRWIIWIVCLLCLVHASEGSGNGASSNSGLAFGAAVGVAAGGGSPTLRRSKRTKRERSSPADNDAASSSEEPKAKRKAPRGRKAAATDDEKDDLPYFSDAHCNHRNIAISTLCKAWNVFLSRVAGIETADGEAPVYIPPLAPDNIDEVGAEDLVLLLILHYSPLELHINAIGEDHPAAATNDAGNIVSATWRYVHACVGATLYQNCFKMNVEPVAYPYGKTLETLFRPEDAKEMQAAYQEFLRTVLKMESKLLRVFLLSQEVKRKVASVFGRGLNTFHRQNPERFVSGKPNEVAVGYHPECIHNEKFHREATHRQWSKTNDMMFTAFRRMVDPLAAACTVAMDLFHDSDDALIQSLKEDTHEGTLSFLIANANSLVSILDECNPINVRNWARKNESDLLRRSGAKSLEDVVVSDGQRLVASRGGVTTGRMRRDAALHFAECIDAGMEKDEALKSVEAQFTKKHVSLLKGSMKGGRTSGDMRIEAALHFADRRAEGDTEAEALEAVKTISKEHHSLLKGAMEGGRTTGDMQTDAALHYAERRAAGDSPNAALESVRKNLSSKHANLQKAWRNGIGALNRVRKKAIADDRAGKPLTGIERIAADNYNSGIGAQNAVSKAAIADDRAGITLTGTKRKAADAFNRGIGKQNDNAKSAKEKKAKGEKLTEGEQAAVDVHKAAGFGATIAKALKKKDKILVRAPCLHTGADGELCGGYATATLESFYPRKGKRSATPKTCSNGSSCPKRRHYKWGLTKAKGCEVLGVLCCIEDDPEAMGNLRNLAGPTCRCLCVECSPNDERNEVHNGARRLGKKP